MKTYIFEKGKDSHMILADNTSQALEKLQALVGDTSGWELIGKQG